MAVVPNFNCCYHKKINGKFYATGPGTSAFPLYPAVWHPHDLAGDVVPVTGGQSYSSSQVADVVNNFSHDVVSENEIDTDDNDDVLSAVALDREARVLLGIYGGSI